MSILSFSAHDINIIFGILSQNYIDSVYQEKVGSDLYIKFFKNFQKFFFSKNEKFYNLNIFGYTDDLDGIFNSLYSLDNCK